MQGGLPTTRADFDASALGDDARSLTDFLDADRFAIGNGLALPIRTETRVVRPLLGTQDRSSGNDGQQRHDEQNAHDVSAGGIPLKPFHPLIIPQHGWAQRAGRGLA
jgi:hypothetical protein